jgi:hypothetical protein
MTVQFRTCVQLIPALVLLTGISTGARSLAAIDDSVIRGRTASNAVDSKQKQIETHNLEEFERRAPIESTGRSVFGRIRHYVGTHKELLASDAFLIAAFSADAVSSIKCQHEANRPEGCTELNKLLGIHPSELTFWGYLGGQETMYITANHLWWHRHPDTPWRHLVWAAPIAWSIYESWVVRANLTFPPGTTKNTPAMTRILSQQLPQPATERLREARARLLNRE